MPHANDYPNEPGFCPFCGWYTWSLAAHLCGCKAAPADLRNPLDDWLDSMKKRTPTREESEMSKEVWTCQKCGCQNYDWQSGCITEGCSGEKPKQQEK